MKIAIMQPYFFPYIGYWQLISSVEKFIIFDDVNYIKKSYINRNTILVNKESQRVTLELIGASQNKNINELIVGNNINKLLKTIEFNYKKAPFFTEVFDLLKDVFNQKEDNLAIFLGNSLEAVSTYLEIETNFIYSSSIEKDDTLKAEAKILDIVKKQKAEIANKFIKASINYNLKEEAYYQKEFKEIINSNDSTYAPLALFFLIDNKILNSNEEINHLFDQILNNVNLEREIKNLVIYKKGLINADFQPENIMIEILKPVINSESFWKPHSLLLLGDYFLFKGERQKAKDFYSQILTSQKTNENIFNQAQQRILKNYGE